MQALIAAERPDLDADATAGVLIGALTSDAVLRMFERGEGKRVAVVVTPWSRRCSTGVSAGQA